MMQSSLELGRMIFQCVKCGLPVSTDITPRPNPKCDEEPDFFEARCMICSHSAWYSKSHARFEPVADYVE